MGLLLHYIGTNFWEVVWVIDALDLVYTCLVLLYRSTPSNSHHPAVQEFRKVTECKLYTSELQLEHCPERFFLLEGFTFHNHLSNSCQLHICLEYWSWTQNNLKPYRTETKTLQYIYSIFFWRKKNDDLQIMSN